jgi:hypothetical protein
MALPVGDEVLPMVGSSNNAILSAVQRLIQRRSGKSRSARKAYVLFSALLLLSWNQAAHANQCFTNGPRYHLESDTVEWRMKIRSSENCVRGVRFSYVWNAAVSLVSPPQSGQVTLVGPGFSYTAKSGFHGEDTFVVRVSGSKNKTSGFSAIRVVVSVVDAREAVYPCQAHFEPN